MKDLNREEMEDSGYPEPHHYAEKLIEFCLNALADDDEHYLTQEVVKGMTFEELIGTLRQADRELSVYGSDE